MNYDQKIDFVTDGETSDGYGGVTPTETTVLSTWAAIEQLKQSRSIEQVQMKLPSTYRVKVQVRSGFYPTVAMRVKWNGKKFNILTSPVVNDVRLKREWIFDICQS